MNIIHDVGFTFDLALEQSLAVSFVRDVGRSLSRAEFLEELRVTEAEATLVSASIPVNAALFGQQRLPFTSELLATPSGARLRGLPLPEARPGWAEVSGEALVTPLPGGSRVRYDFRIAIHLDLPEPEKWGGRALLKMIEYTAARVLENITASFPAAVKAAARALEAAHA